MQDRKKENTNGTTETQKKSRHLCNGGVLPSIERIKQEVYLRGVSLSANILVHGIWADLVVGILYRRAETTLCSNQALEPEK